MSIVNKISRILDGETKMGHCEKIVAILAATGLTVAQLEGLANGTMRVVTMDDWRDEKIWAENKEQETTLLARGWVKLECGYFGRGSKAGGRAVLAAKEG